MSPERCVLDTSAVLTFIEDEQGADRVEEVLQQSQVSIPWLVLLEVHYITQQKRGQAEADRRYALVKQLPATILWEIEEPTVLTAARFKATHRISLADALIAAMAVGQKARLLHKDPEFEALAGQVSLESLPYK
ncbi:MAG: PIN domain-containing protein [Acidobacteriota bacterium]